MKKIWMKGKKRILTMMTMLSHCEFPEVGLAGSGGRRRRHRPGVHGGGAGAHRGRAPHLGEGEVQGREEEEEEWKDIDQYDQEY